MRTLLISMVLMPLAASAAEPAAEFAPYTQRIPGTDVNFEMAPIRGGTFLMGSPAQEAGRDADEGPQIQVVVESFWMGKHEVTWAEYMLFIDEYAAAIDRYDGPPPHEVAKRADAVTLPSYPYELALHAYPGYPKEVRRPAVNMTHYAACQFTKWLSMKTGEFYRLPMEAEWEYAARADSGTSYSFGSDVKLLPEYAWFFKNSNDRSHPVGLKRPNAWGLHDMYGNVAEWAWDQYRADAYAFIKAVRPGGPFVIWPTERYPRVVRGGSWLDDAKDVRSAARAASDRDFSLQNPQVLEDITWHTDARHVGFRVVRPVNPPDQQMRRAFWETAAPEVQKLLNEEANIGRQRRVPIGPGESDE